LSDLLTHLYVLIPVLDDHKHYWVGDAEVEKLLRHGEGWLREHLERELITNRYLKHQKRLAREALNRLIGDEEPEADEVAETRAREEEAIEDMPAIEKGRVRLIHGSLTYRDKRLSGFDAATVVEVIEHQDPTRLSAFERVLFEFACPRTVVVTTPNVEYNVKFEITTACKSPACARVKAG
jgi:Hen1-like subunit of RNA repair complex